MKKKIFIGMGIIFVLIIGLFAYLLLNINPILEKFKPEINSVLTKALNQSIELGQLEANLFPSTKIVIHDVSISGAGSEKPLTLKKLSASTSLSDLLQKKLSVNDLVLEDPEIQLVRNADGSISLGKLDLVPAQNASHQIGGAREKNAKDAGASEDNSPQKSPQQSAINLQIQSVTIKDGSLTFIDKAVSPSATTSLKDLNVALSEIDLGGQAKLKLTSRLFSSKAPDVQISGIIGDPKKGKKIDCEVSLKDFDLGKALTLARSYSQLPSDLDLHDSANLDLTAKSVAEGIQFAAKTNFTQASIKQGSVFSKAAGEELKITADGVSSLQGQLTKASVQANATGTLSAIPFSDLTSALEIANGGLSSQPSSIKLAGQEILFNVSAGKLDGTDLKFTASSKRMLIGELLKAMNKPADRLSDSVLNNLQVNGDLKNPKQGNIIITFADSNVAGAPVNGAKFNIELDNNEIQLKPSSLQAFGGTVQLAVTATGEKDKDVEANISGKSLDFGAILSTFTPTGKFTLSGDLDSLNSRVHGNTASFKQTLTGGVNAVLTNGNIAGFNILQATLGKLAEVPLISASVTSLVPEKYRALVTADSTSFDRLSLQTSMANERADIQSVRLEHQAYTVDGAGWVAFAGDMNIKTQLRFTQEFSEALVAKQPKIKILLDKDGGLVVPVIIKKSDGKTLVLPDFGDLLKHAAGSAAKEAASKALDKVAPGLGGATKLLDGLFK